MVFLYSNKTHSLLYFKYRYSIFLTGLYTFFGNNIKNVTFLKMKLTRYQYKAKIAFAHTTNNISIDFFSFC